MMSYDYPHPVSRTYQYKKITKPLLERKRRARINRCLDELKDLMVDALETEGENISKVEKADILEVTVRHLQKEQSSRPMPSVIIGSTGNWTCRSPWHYGFDLCAKEAYNFLLPQYGDVAEGLAKHLTARLQFEPKTDNLLSSTPANLDRRRCIGDAVASHTGSSSGIDTVTLAAGASPTRPSPSIAKKTADKAAVAATNVSCSSSGHQTSALKKDFKIPVTPIRKAKQKRRKGWRWPTAVTTAMTTAMTSAPTAMTSAPTMMTSAPAAMTVVPIAMTSAPTMVMSGPAGMTRGMQNERSESQGVDGDDDEEIDVEHVDEHSSSCWRPW